MGKKFNELLSDKFRIQKFLYNKQLEQDNEKFC